MPSFRIGLSEFKNHSLQTLITSLDQSRSFWVSRSVESRTTTHPLQKFFRQATSKVSATVRTDNSGDRESHKNLQESFTNSLRIKRSERISHWPPRKFVHQNQSVIVFGLRLVGSSRHDHRTNTIHVQVIETKFVCSRDRSNWNTISNFHWSSELTNLTRCTVVTNPLIHVWEPKI